MQQVDMTKAVKGATVHFRCGGSAVVDRVVVDECYNGLGKRHQVLFKDTNLSHSVMNDGKVMKDLNDIFDIIRIDPPAFDMKDVRNGMAFLGGKNVILFYCGVDPIDTEGGWHILTDKRGGMHRLAACHLTRTPEHDIEVAE